MGKRLAFVVLIAMTVIGLVAVGFWAERAPSDPAAATLNPMPPSVDRKPLEMIPPGETTGLPPPHWVPDLDTQSEESPAVAGDRSVVRTGFDGARFDEIRIVYEGFGVEELRLALESMDAAYVATTTTYLNAKYEKGEFREVLTQSGQELKARHRDADGSLIAVQTRSTTASTGEIINRIVELRINDYPDLVDMRNHVDWLRHRHELSLRSSPAGK